MTMEGLSNSAPIPKLKYNVARSEKFGRYKHTNYYIRQDSFNTSNGIVYLSMQLSNWQYSNGEKFFLFFYIDHYLYYLTCLLFMNKIGNT